MKATDKTSSNSPLFGRFPIIGELSRGTRLMLGVLAITGALYVAVRNMDGRKVSIDTLTTAQKITASALLAIGFLFTISARLYRGSNLAGPQNRLHGSPYSDFPKWMLLFLEKQPDLKVYSKKEDIRNAPNPIVPFIWDNGSPGIRFSLQVKHSQEGILSEPFPVIQVAIMRKKEDPKTWELVYDKYERISLFCNKIKWFPSINEIFNLRKNLCTEWNQKDSSEPVLPKDISALDDFEALEADRRGGISSLDWLVSKWLNGQTCRIKDRIFHREEENQYWFLSLVQQPLPSSSSSPD